VDWKNQEGEAMSDRPKPHVIQRWKVANAPFQHIDDGRDR